MITHVYCEVNHVVDRLKILGVYYQNMLSWGIKDKILKEIKIVVCNDYKQC